MQHWIIMKLLNKKQRVVKKQESTVVEIVENPSDTVRENKRPNLIVVPQMHECRLLRSVIENDIQVNDEHATIVEIHGMINSGNWWRTLRHAFIPTQPKSLIYNQVQLNREA